MSIIRVSQERWMQAQCWERSLWEGIEKKRGWKRVIWPIVRPILILLKLREPVGDDWNYWWAMQFENYTFLPREVDNYIELGCGPYTNTRLILKICKAKHVVCSDPLIRDYLRLRHTWVSRQYHSHSILVDDHPIEQCPYAANYFDVVVMINVLDHVMDAQLCLATATRITKPGGLLVIGQDLTNEEDLKKIPFDIGHPIRLRLEDVESQLIGFSPVLRKVLPRAASRNPDAHYATLIFAGRKDTYLARK